jgi:hypothetical protein
MTIRVQYKVFFTNKDQYLQSCKSATKCRRIRSAELPISRAVGGRGWSCRPGPPGPCGRAAPKAKLSKLRRSADRCPTRRRDPPECPTHRRRTANCQRSTVAGRWALAQRRRRRQTTRLLRVQLLPGPGRRKFRVRGMRACGSAEAEPIRCVLAWFAAYLRVICCILAWFAAYLHCFLSLFLRINFLLCMYDCWTPGYAVAHPAYAVGPSLQAWGATCCPASRLHFSRVLQACNCHLLLHVILRLQFLQLRVKIMFLSNVRKIMHY